MNYTKEEILVMMKNERYPRTNGYDAEWILQNSMGSHCLWLQEILARDMHIRQGMRILDLGCGRAISSIFLAKEFGARIWATDLWIGASENWQRVCETGMQDLICPIHADAAGLPFAENFFDALSSINSLFLYVTDGVFLREKILRFIKPGGEIAVIVPGFLRAYTDGIPDELKPYWSEQLNGWHTLDWWKACFDDSGEADIILADMLPNNEGNTIYMESAKMVNAHEEPFNVIAGNNITFIRIIAKRKKA